MSAPLRLIIFDVDGTLADSQIDIVAAMTRAFTAAGHIAPSHGDILSIVGLSLPIAIARLAPALDSASVDALVTGYKSAFYENRLASGGAHSPLYPHALDVLRILAQAPEHLLGVATGKSRRGLDALIDLHGLNDMFITQQVADHHPSKPNPAMVLAAMDETGVAPHNTVMIGDTSYDMEMARAAGVRSVGVTWGYHTRENLSAATVLLDDFRALPDLLNTLWETPI